MPNNAPLNQITYLILAGGRGQRMQGADKGLLLWQGKPMIEHIIQHINAPAEKIIISANRNIETYQQYTNMVINDGFAQTLAFEKTQEKAFLGPLAGILSAMHSCTTPYILCLPCDSPTPPDDLLNQLWACLQTQQKNAALCHDGNRLQPLFALLSCEYRPLLQDFLQQGRHKVQDFFKLIEPAICDFSAQQNRFHNINRPDDMR